MSAGPAESGLGVQGPRRIERLGRRIFAAGNNWHWPKWAVTKETNMAKKTVTSTTKPFVSAMQQTAQRGGSTAVLTNPTREQIAARAYEIYCERNRAGRSGDAKSDWVAAEAQLRARANR